MRSLAWLLLAPAHLTAQLPQRTLVATFRLGGVNAPEYAAFAREPTIVADSDGTIFVRTAQPPTINVFDAQGRFVRTIGREGEGPGEFTIAGRHGVLADTLWVLDPVNARVTLFDREGTVLATRPSNPDGRGTDFGSQQFTTVPLLGGHVIQIPGMPPPGTDHPLEAPIRFRPDASESPRQVGTLTVPTDGLLVPGVGVFWLRDFPAFPPLISVASNGGGWAYVDDDEANPAAAVISRYSASGELVWTRTLESPRTPVSDTARDRLVDAALEIFTPDVLESTRRWAEAQGEPAPRGTRKDMVEDALGLPDFYAPFDDVVMGRDGSVWLRRGSEGRDAEWLILDPPASHASRPGCLADGRARSDHRDGLDHGAR